MKTEQRTVYIPSDGKEFTCHVEASNYESRLELEELVEKFSCRGMDSRDVVEGLIEHKEEFCRILDGFV